MSTNNHEVIFAIINSGYADEAMAVARENGARGGTIINARGVQARRRQPSSASPSMRKRKF